MKRTKFWLPLIAIIFIAASVFAMKENKSSAKIVNKVPPTTYRWFKITGTHAAGVTVPPADANYLQTSATPPPDQSCTGATNQCISGFDAIQTTPSGSGYVLKPNQAPDATAPNVLRD